MTKQCLTLFLAFASSHLLQCSATSLVATDHSQSDPQEALPSSAGEEPSDTPEDLVESDARVADQGAEQPHQPVFQADSRTDNAKFKIEAIDMTDPAKPAGIRGALCHDGATGWLKWKPGGHVAGGQCDFHINPLRTAAGQFDRYNLNVVQPVGMGGGAMFVQGLHDGAVTGRKVGWSKDIQHSKCSHADCDFYLIPESGHFRIEAATPGGHRGELAVWDMSNANRRRDSNTRDVKWHDKSRGPCEGTDCHFYVTKCVDSSCSGSLIDESTGALFQTDETVSTESAEQVEDSPAAPARPSLMRSEASK